MSKDIKYIKAKTKAKDDGTIQMVVFSDSSVDRAGDTINPEGWKLNNFKRNPVLLWAHDAGFDKSVPAIGNVEGLHVDSKGRLVGSLKFDMDDEFAKKVHNKYKKGILRATSVGFMPLDFEEKDNGRFHFKEQELLEVSSVNVPANQNALTQLRGMKGKSAKTQAKLMKEFLEKHSPDKKIKKEEKQEDERDPMAERLDNIVIELENATNALKRVVEQVENRAVSNHDALQTLNDLADAVRVADKANEIFLKKVNSIKKQKGGEKNNE